MHVSVDRYLFKPCDTSWKDGIIALEAGEAQPLHTLQYTECIRNPDERVLRIFCVFRGPGSGMGTLQQLLNRDTTLFDKMTTHQVYSFIRLVDASPLPSLFLCATTGGMMTRLSLLVVSSLAMRT
jgi:hypothetical protein